MIKLNTNQPYPKWHNAKQQSDTPPSDSKLDLGRLGCVLLATSLVLLGCDTKQAESAPEPVAEVTSEDDNKLLISPSAEAVIKEFEAEFIQQMINLQQSQQAEYEALQAADAPDMEVKASQTLGGELNKTIDLEDSSDNTQNVVSQSNYRTDVSSSNELDTNNQANAASATLEGEISSAESTTDSGIDSENDRIGDNQATDEEVTAVTLQDLPLATNMVLVQPKILTAQEISSRYNTAMQSLYLPEDLPLPAQVVDTLLNIATLTPNVFSNPELAQRLIIKSPALARFLKQYQKWEQLEIEHSEELEALKEAQLESQRKQGEDFDALAKEFATKIEEYDKQIEKYEKMLEDMAVNE